jgi:tetratricopeptide (TPR) repeat protein
VDEATLDVLRLVLRRLDGVPALVVLSYRDDELDRRHPLRTLLGELSLARPALRLDVEPLSAEAVAAMAGSLALDSDDLFRKTAGNPFFVTEVLAAPGTEIPETLRDAVLARAARLSEAGGRLLETVALLPPHVELRLLETLAPGSAGSLEECLTSGMLRAEPGRVVFRHELARLAIEESLPPDERLELHRQALAALGEPPGGEPDLARVAYHAEQAGDGDAVRRFAPAAAEHAASVGAHREAADQHARALRFIGPQQHAERARLLELMATEDYLTDRNPEAIEALHEALEHYRALGDERGEGNALRLLAGYLWCPGRIAEAEDAGRRAVSLLEGLDHDRELGDAYGAMSFLHRAAGGGEDALLWSRRTFEIAERLDDEEFRIAASAALGEAEVLAGAARGYERFEHARGRHRPWLVGELALWRRRGGADAARPGRSRSPTRSSSPASTNARQSCGRRSAVPTTRRSRSPIRAPKPRSAPRSNGCKSSVPPLRLRSSRGASGRSERAASHGGRVLRREATRRT